MISLVIFAEIFSILGILISLKNKGKYTKPLLIFNLSQFVFLFVSLIIMVLDGKQIIDFSQLEYFHLVRIGIAILYKFIIYFVFPVNCLFIIYIIIRYLNKRI